jgi:serine/threonine-protein kinase
MSGTTTRSQQALALFDELIELDEVALAQRMEILRAQDPALHQEVHALLSGDAKPAAVFEHPPTALRALADVQPGDANDDADALLGERIGAWRITGVLGRGGMGAVYRGEREDSQFQQQAALKLIRIGLDQPALRRRFLAERQILARLKHPNIAALYDGGVDANGSPWFAMELIDGIPIDRWCNERNLNLRQRVRLFEQVCNAVQHAHQNLTVHRDLKPGNILVTADGQAKLLDFGIAKLLQDGAANEATVERMFTPEYAAPEQSRGEAITTATDVYALGVVLSRVLADAPPLHGDLNAIVQHCLQEDPQRRYPSVEALGNDLRAWLEGRPVMARPGSAAYRLRKFVARHRLGVAAAAAALLVIAATTILAIQQSQVARGQARLAQQQLARSEQVKQFILTLFREQDPVARAQSQQRTPAQLVREGIVEVEASLGAQPDLQAELLRDLGEIQAGVDEPAQAIETLLRAWQMQQRLTGQNSAASVESLAAYADALAVAAGDVAKAEPLLREARDHLRASGRGETARAAQIEASLSRIALNGGRNEEAEELARHALAVDGALYGASSMQAATRLAALGSVQQETGRYDEALATYREALVMVTTIGGADHARNALLHSSLGDVLRYQRRYADALPEYEAAVRIMRAQLPPKHRLLGMTLARLGDLQRRMRHLEDADRSLVEALDVFKGTGSGQYAQALQFHALVARFQGNFELTAQRLGAAVEAFRATTGDGIYTCLTSLMHVEALLDAGHLTEAETMSVSVGAALAQLPEEPYAKWYHTSVQGRLRHEQGRISEAIALRRDSLAALIVMYGDQHAEVPLARVLFASSLVASGGIAERNEAARLIESTRTALTGKADADDPDASALWGRLLLEHSRIRAAEGDVAGAKTALADAMKYLQAQPENAAGLQEARRFERILNGRI